MTPGPEQNGDTAGDGPGPENRDSIYWGWIVAVWRSIGSKNLKRVDELKVKYKGSNPERVSVRTYGLYTAVCQTAGAVPKPPLVPEDTEFEVNVVRKEEPEPPLQRCKVESREEQSPEPPAQPCKVESQEEQSHTALGASSRSPRPRVSRDSGPL